MPGRSIRIRMTVVFSLLIAIFMIAISSGLIWYTRHIRERNTDTRLIMAIQKLKAECLNNNGSLNMKLLAEEEREDLRPDGISLAVMSPLSKIIWSSQNGPHLQSLLRGRTWRTIKSSIGHNTVIVGMPWQHIDEELRYYEIVLILLSVLVTVVVAIGAWILVGHTLSPIALLARQADTASTESLHVNLREPSADAEIVGLVTTLNGLLSRLAETAKAKGRFYSAASHELRTPLQALSGHLELALTRERTADEYKQFVNESYAQTRRLILLVRNLLLLYQLDSSAGYPTYETSDLSSVCRQVITQYQPMIIEKGLNVKTALVDGRTFTAPPAHIEILVRNLIENAVKYADTGSDIILKLSDQSSILQLDVINKCFSEEEWNEEQLYEPFGRRDASRDSKTGGTGLGLTICKVIADTNKWNLSLRQEDGEICATIIIPKTQSNLLSDSMT